MTEYRLVSFRWPTAEILPLVTDVKIRTIDFTNSHPQLAEHMDGWEVINTQVIPMGEFTVVIYSMRTVAAEPIRE